MAEESRDGATRKSRHAARAALADLPEVVPVSTNDRDPGSDGAPRPIDVDPSETGSFQRINAGQGARVTTRANASETASMSLEAIRAAQVRMDDTRRPKVEHHEQMQSYDRKDRRVFVGLSIAAIIVVALVCTLVVRALTSAPKEEETTTVERTQTSDVEEGIEYRGPTYSLAKQKSGKYALVKVNEGSEKPVVLFELKGEPVTLILHDSAFVVPENLSDGTWDVMALTLGGGGMPMQVTDSEGNPVVGTGRIAEASLDEDIVVVTTDAGEQVSISLV